MGTFHLALYCSQLLFMAPLSTQSLYELNKSSANIFMLLTAASINLKYLRASCKLRLSSITSLSWIYTLLTFSNN